MINRATPLLPILLILVPLAGCCLEVINGLGGTSGGTTGGTGGADSGPPMTCPQAGTCASDGDCVVAWCASAICGGCDHYAVSKNVLSDDPCAVEIGPSDGPTTGTLSPACQDVSPMDCGCFAHPYCVPRCLSGTCDCADAGP